MMIKVNSQRGLWEFHREEESQIRDSANNLGPYRVGADDEIGRKFECSNYEACLGFAAAHKWGSFTCRQCYLTKHGVFV